ncbi:pyrimidine-nucleoside phosphorylase [[Clostridium] fimetarium]|uniref:Pyrimidine-nucleoside phosphorylase n=1 Tax=[Clostridium] fimetarium TaxID=99656 RepID=A0A1I0Q1N8_9FIRM|nr:pyrimidine-nucleoside phosphorylase [[Clostridium] fimetarium]SEW20750.1 pyrimidine-nucleoside phosphorylase [[Clostridium] fimetarium]
MRMYDLIMKKRNSEELSKEEIEYMIQEYTKGLIPDYQMAAFLMAVYFNKMTDKETVDLTMAMANSGDILDLSAINGIKVDKHSTGGVGDKTSLVVGPMVAALGVPVAKMSGRGLGHTGGTIDKLESFPGFSTSMSEEQFFKNVNSIKIAITGQTGNLAPADKKLYALRDVTATVDNLSLIASSIMSKKIAAGADVIVLDVKTGSGAFMKKEEDAFALAKEMVKIGDGAGRKTVAIVSDMDQPLGYAVGNALEVIEAIDTLNGKGPSELLELCVILGTYMLIGAEIATNEAQARKMLLETIENKTALNKLAEFVEAQGGDKAAVFNTDLLLRASIIEEITSSEEGYVEHIESEEIGIVSMLLGGGRETKESKIDLAVGLVLHKKVGDKVNIGDSIATIYANDAVKLATAKKRFNGTYTFSQKPIEKKLFIKGIIK